MKLTDRYRSALLDSLQELLSNRDETRSKAESDSDAKPFYEIDDWLVTVQITAIRDAIIKDEIDLF